jgi:hypothetical protein
VLLLHYATVVTDTGVSRWCSSAITVFPRGTVAWGEPVVLVSAVGFAAAAAAAAVLNIVIFPWLSAKSLVSSLHAAVTCRALYC